MSLIPVQLSPRSAERARRRPFLVAAVLAAGLGLSACGAETSAGAADADGAVQAGNPADSAAADDGSAPAASTDAQPPDTAAGATGGTDETGGAGETGGPEDSDVSDDAGVPPVAVNIPAIEVEESLIDLGIAADGTMEVPEDWNDVGWFDGGGMPGGLGPTVLAGHVDSTTGPAVFHRLEEIVAGDEVFVTDAEGTLHEYRVERTAVFPKNDFPTQEVFGVLPEDELRLITCTGRFDQEVQSHEDNHIVFAVPVDSADAP